MPTRLGRALPLLLMAACLRADVPGNAALKGKFYFVQLLVTASGGQATGARNLSGAIAFDGSGGYSFSGKSASGSSAPAAASGSGTYKVAPSGIVALTNPLQSSLQIAARLSADGNVLLGASTEAPDNTNDLFVALRAPAAGLTNAVLNGAYTGASLQLPNGQSSGMRSALIALSASGAGQFSQMSVLGHAVDQGGSNLSQSAGGATYTIAADGTGSADFGSAASLFSGAREIFVSQDGNYVIGDPAAAGARGLFLATTNFTAAADAASLSGRYWIAELTMAGQSAGGCSSFDFEGASGAFQALGAGTAIFSERIHVNSQPVDFTGLNSYSVNADGTGALAPVLNNTTNMALGVAAGAVVGAQVGAAGTTSCDYGLFFAVRAPTFSAAGSAPFLDPAGVVNTASFAPFPNPTAPGALTSVFGVNLASGPAGAPGVPLPVSLGGVSVTVNGTPAPLYYVSPTQINFQTPFEAAGSTAAIQVTSNGVKSNTVTVPLAPTSPGILQYLDAGDPYRAIAQHSDGTLVSAVADLTQGLGGPAAVGEIIAIYVAGLGALQPPVVSGAANPSSPPATVADPHVTILIGGEVATHVDFIGGTPNFPGLYQINVQIPATVLPGPNVPVEIVTGNADSDLTDIPIADD